MSVCAFRDAGNYGSFFVATNTQTGRDIGLKYIKRSSDNSYMNKQVEFLCQKYGLKLEHLEESSGLNVEKKSFCRNFKLQQKSLCKEMLKRCHSVLKACGDPFLHLQFEEAREFEDTLKKCEAFELNGTAEANPISDRKFMEELKQIKLGLDKLRSAKEAEFTPAVKEATEQLLQMSIQKPGEHSQKKIYFPLSFPYLSHQNLSWDVMCVIEIKDLGGQQNLYCVEVKCQDDTTVAALKKCVEWMLDFLSENKDNLSHDVAFSCPQVLTTHAGLTAHLNWLCTSGQLLCNAASTSSRLGRPCTTKQNCRRTALRRQTTAVYGRQRREAKERIEILYHNW